jgi:alkylation response protein AidB-like acyl-CoA dehydrogenase
VKRPDVWFIRLAGILAGGGLNRNELPRTKMVVVRVAVEVAQEAMRTLGGYMLEYGVERYYRDARITEIYNGTQGIQKNTIASAVRWLERDNRRRI